MQMLQFIILLAVMFSFFGLGLTPVVLKWMNVSPDALASLSDTSPRNVINAALVLQFLSALGIFMVPALLFAYFTHPRPIAYLGLKAPKNGMHILLCIIIIVAATPLLLTIAEWMSSMNLEAAKKAQEVNDRYMKAFLSMNSIPQLLVSLLVLAVLAGLSEELFFRGLLMRFTAKRIKSVSLPIVITAILFAAMHSNVYGLPSIFIAGILLGYFYYLTGSLWSSMIAHIVYNGLQVLLIYFADKHPTIATMNETNHVPLLWTIAGTAISASGLYLLWKTRTPLESDWAQDYSKEEREKLMAGEDIG